MPHQSMGAAQITNTVLTQLYFQIRALKLIPITCHAHTLILQANNSTSENKNKYLLGMLSLLVHHGWYRRIFLFYRMPGHTHDRKNVNSNKCRDTLLTAKDILQDLTKKHYRAHVPPVVYLKDIYNWKDNLEPQLFLLFNHPTISLSRLHVFFK